jgi:hypothetical protein
MKIATAIKTSYPAVNVLKDKASMNIWYMMLSDIDYQICQNAVLELISTLKFPPTIAEIREKCSMLTSLPVKDWGEAWEEVLMAIRRFGYPQELEAMNSLDDLTRKCVKRISYQNICMSDNISADRANFRMIYETEAQRKRTDNQLPLSLKTEKQIMLDRLISETSKQIEAKEDL